MNIDNRTLSNVIQNINGASTYINLARRFHKENWFNESVKSILYYGYCSTEEEAEIMIDFVVHHYKE